MATKSKKLMCTLCGDHTDRDPQSMADLPRRRGAKIARGGRIDNLKEKTKRGCEDGQQCLWLRVSHPHSLDLDRVT